MYESEIWPSHETVITGFNPYRDARHVTDYYKQ